MRLHVLRSLRTQTLAVLLVGLTIPHAIGIPIYSIDRGDVVASTEALDMAERSFGILTLLQRLPEQWRADVIRGSDGRVFRVSLDSSAGAAGFDADSDLVTLVRAYLNEHIPTWSDDRIVVAVHEPSESAEAGERTGPIAVSGERRRPAPKDGAARDFLHLSFRLDDGKWLNIVGTVKSEETLWPGLAGVYILSVAAGVTLVAMWLVGRVTSPLAAFARAAKNLGKNLRSEPLSEQGPLEVAEASRAFNEMQERLRRLIENRTHLLAAISHDLRTPITLLRLRAELMDDVNERERTLGTLDEMETMLRAVLQFSRETYDDEPQRLVDLSALLGSICDDLIDTGARVEFEGPDGLLCLCRRIALKRALTNLIDNAIKYGGIAHVRLADEMKTVGIVIDDEGPGIPENQLAKVFMPFYRLDPSRGRATGGTGLGLSIAQAIVHQHGGTIKAGNRPEGGLRIHVSLPK